MVVEGFPEEHFENLVESKLSIELYFDVFHDGVNVLVTKLCSCNQVGSLQLLSVQNSVLVVVDDLERFNIKLVAAVHYHFSRQSNKYVRGDELKELLKINEAVAVLVDGLDDLLKFLLWEILANGFEDLIELLW